MSKAKKANYDKWFRAGCCACAGLTGFIAAGIFFQLTARSAEAWQQFGLGFLVSSEWDPSAGKFGALPSIIGTLATTAIAMGLAFPLSFSSARYLMDAPPMVSRILSQAIDLLAAIPSVLFGMWGLFVMVPIMQDHVQPALFRLFGNVPLIGKLVSEWGNGFGILTAGLILSLMILPYICAVMRDVFKMTPQVLLEAAYGAGCTRREVAHDIVLPYGIKGVIGGAWIGLGRALGETMAVLFVIGNVMEFPQDLFSGGTTIASTIANAFPEAQGLERSALFALGLVLLITSFALQCVAQRYVAANQKGRKA